MKRVLTLLCCFSLCSISGLAQKKSARPAMSDQQFVDFAGQTDMVDANLGQLANSANPSLPIKDYAQKLVTDQTTDFRKLLQIAHEAHLQVPSAIDKEQNKTMVGPLQELKGTAFDRRFVKEMIAGDTKAIKVYEKEVDAGQSLDVRDYAQAALPGLRTHLADAKELEESTASAAKKG